MIFDAKYDFVNFYAHKRDGKDFVLCRLLQTAIKFYLGNPLCMRSLFFF